MLQEFRVSTIEADLKNKSIIITCTMDIDPTTVIVPNIQLIDLLSRNDVDYIAKLSGKIITLELTDWPEPNIDYIISLQNLKSVLGDLLVSGVRRKIVFESSICSKLEIIYPAYNEVITDLRVAWKEVLASEEHQYINSFHIEISTENAFHNIYRTVDTSDRNEIDLSELPTGQYYVRGRVQKDGEYGSWSNIVTFLIGTESADPGPIFDPGEDEGNDDDIYVPGIEVLSKPENGETPTSIIIEFDCDIDPASLVDIIVIRRVI